MPLARQQRRTTGGCRGSVISGACGSRGFAATGDLHRGSRERQRVGRPVLGSTEFRVLSSTFKVESRFQLRTQNSEPGTVRPTRWRSQLRAPNHGVTLVELLTVIAIIALLAGIAIGGIRGVKERANIARARSDLAALATALEEYKRYYGEYPYLGPPDFNQANPLMPINTATGPGMQTVQAKLFNALTGVFGPRAFGTSNRVSGPNLLDVSRFTLNPATLLITFQVPIVPGPAQPPVKQEQNVGILDPWGRYYLYYYKSSRNPNAWQATGYLLYSVGPDGAHTIPPNTGLLTPAQRNAANNADNIHANP